MSLVKKYFWVFFVSMVPLVELRGAIPIAFGDRKSTRLNSSHTS